MSYDRTAIRGRGEAIFKIEYIIQCRWLYEIAEEMVTIMANGNELLWHPSTSEKESNVPTDSKHQERL